VDNPLREVKYIEKKIYAGVQAKAVDLVKQSNRSVPGIAGYADINDNMLRLGVNWKQRPQTLSWCGYPRDEELARLKKELSAVTQERAF